MQNENSNNVMFRHDWTTELLILTKFAIFNQEKKRTVFRRENKEINKNFVLN